MSTRNKRLSSLPLSGITIIDLSRLIPGPFCSLILNDLGARVIKVEDTEGGDYLRSLEGTLFQAFNRNKESISLDLKKKEGKLIFQKLLKKGDVLIESFRPDVMKRLGFSPSQLKKINPQLIIASITGFGQTGPNRDKAGHDLNYLSLAGILNSPECPSIPFSDLVGGGLWGAFSVMTALFQRQKSKKGAHLDISMTDSMIFLGLGNLVMSQLGMNFQQNILSGILARYRIYKTKDHGFVSLAALEDKFFSRFCDVIGKNHLKEKSKNYKDASPEVHQELSELFLSKTKKEWEQFATKYDICLTPLLSPSEVLTDSQFQSRRFFHKTKLNSQNILFPFTPLLAKGKVYPRFKKAPKQGEHTKKILKELGIK